MRNDGLLKNITNTCHCGLFEEQFRNLCYNSSMEKFGYVYILTNIKHTVFYTGVTSNLTKRMYEHSNELVEGFTKRYHLHKLMYYEIYNSIETALNREKQIKKWKKEWKWKIIDKLNPSRMNLYQNNEIIPINMDLIEW